MNALPLGTSQLNCFFAFDKCTRHIFIYIYYKYMTTTVNECRRCGSPANQERMMAVTLGGG